MVVQEWGCSTGQNLPCKPILCFIRPCQAEQTHKPLPGRPLPLAKQNFYTLKHKRAPLPRRVIFLISTGLTIKISYKLVLIMKGWKTPLWQVSTELGPLTLWAKATGAAPPLPFVALFEFTWLMLYVQVYWGTAFKRIVYHGLVINLP